MITGKVNINTDFFSKKVFNKNKANFLYPINEQDEEEKDTGDLSFIKKDGSGISSSGETGTFSAKKKPKLGLNH